MLRVLVVALLLVGAYAADVFVCYHTNWSQYRPSGGKFFPYDIDPFLCTHLIYSFAKIENGKLEAYEWNDKSEPWMVGMYEHFSNLKEVNPALKNLLAVGGWTHGSTGFTEMVATADSRKIFIDDSIKYLRKWKFDGLDLDWEYPGDNARTDDPEKKPENKERFTLLCEELRAAYEADHVATGRPRLLLTAAVAAGEVNMDAAYEINKISQSLDFINLMSYDLRGAWESVTGHHTTTHPDPSDTADNQKLTVEWAVDQWLERGCPANKLVLGMGSYGRTFTLSTTEHGIGAPVKGGGSAGQFTREAGFWSYYEVCSKIRNNGFKTDNDDIRKVIYAYSNTEWVGYDDINSIDDKIAIINEKNLLGGMVWALDLDDFAGTYCGQGKWPMIKAMKEKVLGPGYTYPTVPPTTPTLYPTTTLPYSGPPEEFCQGRSDGIYPSGDCSETYYQCIAGNTNIQTCAGGTVYNSGCGCCDWRENTPGCSALQFEFKYQV